MFLSSHFGMETRIRHFRHSMRNAYALVGAMALFLSAAFLTGCQPHEGSESQLRADIDSFATYYYNWHFEKANKYCTPESEKWLRFAASNVHQADIDLLNKKTEDATIEISDINFHDDEVTADIQIDVTNFLQMDTLGTEAHHVNKATFIIPMTLHQDKWKVDLKELPLKEK